MFYAAFYRQAGWLFETSKITVERQRGEGIFSVFQEHKSGRQEEEGLEKGWKTLEEKYIYIYI